VTLTFLPEAAGEVETAICEDRKDVALKQSDCRRGGCKLVEHISDKQTHLLELRERDADKK
jgi:hypothetical protein